MMRTVLFALLLASGCGQVVVLGTQSVTDLATPNDMGLCTVCDQAQSPIDLAPSPTDIPLQDLGDMSLSIFDASSGVNDLAH